MADDMKRLESELGKGVNKRQALTAMGGGKGGKKAGKATRKRTRTRKRGQ